MFSLARIAIALLLSWPAAAGATVGFAERHSELLYNDLASIHWIHPGDGCDCGKSCFQVVRKQSPHGSFRGLYRSIGKINLPTDPRSPLILAQTCADGHWIVYDLGAEEYLVDSPSYELALASLGSPGTASPLFADAADGAKGLRETPNSFVENLAFAALMWLPFLAVLAFPLGLVASLVLFVRYRRTRRGRNLAWAVLALLPTLPGLWLVWVVIFGVSFPPGR
jgi:hypothetical protein